jgi:hypothetical protein
MDANNKTIWFTKKKYIYVHIYIYMYRQRHT